MRMLRTEAFSSGRKGIQSLHEGQRADGCRKRGFPFRRHPDSLAGPIEQGHPREDSSALTSWLTAGCVTKSSGRPGKTAGRCHLVKSLELLDIHNFVYRQYNYLSFDLIDIS